jgi:hypothetical protein
MAVAVLVAAASALAATGGLNSYTAKLSFSPNKAGSGKAPSSLAYTQKYVANGTGGNRTAPLTDIKVTMYGLVTDGKDFPTCSANKIATAGSDTGCPKGALVATGSITATLGPENDQSTTAPGQLSCNPLLDVWNGGQGKAVFFFVVKGSHQCANGAIQTGGILPFVGTFKTAGKNLVLDTPIPSKVSFPLPGFEGSLTSETLNWKNLSKKLSNGKTARYTVSTACKGGKRPYTVAFSAQPGASGPSVSQTVTGSQKCS